MYRGINSVALDAKGRLSIPSRYREALVGEGSPLIITIDTEEPCLLIYPVAEWAVIEQKLQALPSFHPATRRIQRLLIGHATDVAVDKSGRVLLPPMLREYAALDSRGVLIGQGKKFELWSEENWHSKRDAWLKTGLNADEMPPELENLSL